MDCYNDPKSKIPYNTNFVKGYKFCGFLQYFIELRYFLQNTSNAITQWQQPIFAKLFSSKSKFEEIHQIYSL